MADVFLSYAREDLPFILRLTAALHARNREVRVDLEGIIPSARWMEEIRTAVTEADAVAFVHLHTGLLTQAREWETRDRDRSLLLRGGELEQAETWLADQTGRKPVATPAQAQLVLTSRAPPPAASAASGSPRWRSRWRCWPPSPSSSDRPPSSSAGSRPPVS
ncbi:MAG: toll/interleukin-1 receptor domain-containing protein [Pseudonocardiales bacterium]|nr:toll/interleukin-1 receptor domain-containing protein [Pseudonocardiales bacterium]MBV9031591.1 toll/interleukin-1 receptor domain-containing protein [Pseudonocardiales bacterium]